MTPSDRQNPLYIPGFVDLQVNGYLGVDFSSPELTPESFTEVSRKLINHGTSMFLPTIITSSEEIFERNLKIISDCMEQDEFRYHLPAIHVDGPLCRPHDGSRGVYNRDLERDRHPDFLVGVYVWSAVKQKLLTSAAEAGDVDDLCRQATKLQNTVSLGHQMAC